MYVDEEMIQGMEERFGWPEVLRLTQVITPEEMALVRGSQKHGRAHDITLFIFRGEKLALIRKPIHPPGVFRAPSGGLNPEEPFEEGAKREAREETGLEIEIERYLLRIQVRFICGEENVEWSSHVFSAEAVGGELAPQDTREIVATRWATLEELQGPIREAALALGWGLLDYRVTLTDRAVALLKGETDRRSETVSGGEMKGLTLLAVFAHPDDESFGPAATLARYVAQGVRVVLVCATRGEAGEISDPQLATPETLGEVREEELRSACRVIGIQELHFLGYRDGQMKSYDPQEVEGKVVRAIREVKPQVVLTFGPDGISGHLDHITIGKATTDAFFSAGDEKRFSEHIAEGLSPYEAQKLYYVAVPRSRFRAMSLDLPGTCDDRITAVIDAAPFLEVKRRAIACHKTQLPPGSLFAQMSDEEMRKWWGEEYFVLAASRVGLSLETETDLFWDPGA